MLAKDGLTQVFERLFSIGEIAPTELNAGFSQRMFVEMTSITTLYVKAPEVLFNVKGDDV